MMIVRTKHVLPSVLMGAVLRTSYAKLCLPQLMLTTLIAKSLIFISLNHVFRCCLLLFGNRQKSRTTLS